MAILLEHKLSTWLQENFGLAVKEQEDIGAAPSELSLAYLGTVIATKLRKSINREEATELAKQTLQGFGRKTIEILQQNENPLPNLHNLMLNNFDISPHFQVQQPDDRTLEVIVERQAWLAEVVDGVISRHCQPHQDSVAVVRINLNGNTRFIIQERESRHEQPKLSQASNKKIHEMTRQVLVVDDDPDIRTFAKHIFEQLEWEVSTANDGRHALAKLYQESFQLVLVDGDMPNLNGPETVKRIRATEQRNHMAPAFIIGMSANVSDTTRSRAIIAGCDLFIEKPLDLDIIDQILQAKFGHSKTPKLHNIDPIIAPLLPPYVEQRIKELHVLRQAISQKDQNTLKRMVHKIKGSGSSYGLKSLSTAASLLETQVLAENWYEADCALNELEGHLHQAQQDIEQAKQNS